MEESEIVYQNKDVVSKKLAELFPKTTFEVYGIKTPRVECLMPTNLPVIKVNELRLDNFFRFEDGSYGIVDYESIYDEKDKIKYLDYVTRAVQQFWKERNLRIRVIIIYTADVKRSEVREGLDVGDVKIHLEQAFLSELDREGIKKNLTEKVMAGKKLTDREKMQFIILPLAYEGKEKKQELIQYMFELAKQIEDEDEQTFVVAGMIAFADKVIDVETADYMKGWLGMTKVGRLIEEEKMQAVREATTKVGRLLEEEKKQAVKEATTKVGRLLEEEKKHAVEQAKIEKDRNLARQMLEDGEPEEKIYRYAPLAAAEVLCESKTPYGKER